MMLLYGLVTLLLAYWFKRELERFPMSVNQQHFTEYQAIFPLSLSWQEFLEYSHLVPKESRVAYWFFILFPVAFFILKDLSLPIALIGIILIYLSVLDCLYYLTESKYLALIFCLALANLVFYDVSVIQPKIFSLFVITLFFYCFIPVINRIFQKEALGLGDVMLFCALAPLFELEEMVWMLLCSSLLGIAFSLGYGLFTKRKISKLPFIPFISFSTFLLFAVRILVH